MNLFIANAHANDNLSLSNKTIKANGLCYYGGWISVKNTHEGESICTHPGKIKDFIQRVGIGNYASQVKKENVPLFHKIAKEYQDAKKQSPQLLN